MITESKIIVFLLGAATLAFVLLNKRSLRRIDHFKFLIASFFIILLSWFFAIAETFILNRLFNFLEHTCYIASAAYFFIWISKTARPKEND